MNTSQSNYSGGLVWILLGLLTGAVVLPFGKSRSSAPALQVDPPESIAAADLLSGTKRDDAEAAPLEAPLRGYFNLPAAQANGRAGAARAEPYAESLAWNKAFAGVKLDFMLLLVADPALSGMGFRTDLQLDALQKSLGADGYVIDRWRIPWAGGKQAAGQPGVLLFRRIAGHGWTTPAKPAEQQLLLVYLVGELATSGVDRVAFGAAVEQILRLRDLSALEGDDHAAILPVLGPNFSGSGDSFAFALRDARHEKLRIQVLNSSARSLNLERFRELAGISRDQIGSTILKESFLRQVLLEYIKRQRPFAKPRVAWLTESGTALGAGAGPPQDERITTYPFPLHISRVRDAYAANLGKQPAVELVPNGDRAVLQFPPDGRSDVSDVLPRLTPGMQAPYAELTLRRILLELAREGYDAVGITASDPRDTIFLVQQIRRYTPQTQLLLIGGDQAFEHPAYRGDFYGALVISPYPMFAANQTWSYSPAGGRTRYVFNNPGGYALFNAVSLTRAWRLPEPKFSASWSETGGLLVRSAADIELLEYGQPHASGAMASESPELRPVPWISIFGHQGAWPLTCSVDIQEPCDSLQYTLSFQPPCPSIQSSSPKQAAAGSQEKPAVRSPVRVVTSTHQFGWMVVFQWTLAAAVYGSWSGALRGSWVEPLTEISRTPASFTAGLAVLLALWFQASTSAVFACTAVWTQLGENDNLALPAFCLLIALVLPGLFRSGLAQVVAAGAVAAVLAVILSPWFFEVPNFTALGIAILAVFAATYLLHMLLVSLLQGLSGYLRPRASVDRDSWLVFAAAIILQCLTLVGVIYQWQATPAVSLPWLATSAWVFNGVSPHVVIGASCLAIATLGYAELARFSAIRNYFIPERCGLDDENSPDFPRQAHDLTEPWQSRGVSALIYGMGLLLFSVWLAVVWLRLLPLLPFLLLGWIVAGLILLGFWMWAWLLVRGLAITRRFFFVLQEFRREIRDQREGLAAAIERMRRPQDLALGRFLYSLRPPRKLYSLAIFEHRIMDAAAQLGGALPGVQREQLEEELAARKQERRAVGMKLFVRYIALHLRLQASALAVAGALLFIAASSLPFQPRSWFLITSTLTFVALGAAVVWTMIRVEADEVLSRIAGSSLASVSWDWQFIQRAAPWVLVPLLLVIGQTFPELWQWLSVIAASWRGD